MILVVFLALLLYGLVHSILASKETKDAIRKRVGDRVYHGFYRAGFNIFAIISILPVLYLVGANPGDTVYSLNADWETPMTIIQIVGMIGFVVSLVQIDFWRFTGLKQMWAYFTGGALPLTQERLKTGGIFALVRHPLYLFSLMLVWSPMGMSEAAFGMNLGITAYFILGSYYEEKRMVQAFGVTYTDYQQRVPWLIPSPMPLLRRHNS